MKPTICAGPTDQFDGRKRRQRHQLAAGVAHVVAQDFVRLHARGAVGLHDHALHAAAVREVVDVVRAEIGRDRVVDLLEGHAERRRLLAVDIQFDLRRGRQAFDIDILQDRAARGGREQLILRAHQFGIALLAAILQTEAEAGRIAEIVDRRRLQRRDLGVADRLAELLVDVGDDALGGIVRTALRPVLQRDEGLRRVHALAEEAEAGQERDLVDARALQQIFLGRLDRLRACGCRKPPAAPARPP